MYVPAAAAAAARLHRPHVIDRARALRVGVVHPLWPAQQHHITHLQTLSVIGRLVFPWPKAIHALFSVGGDSTTLSPSAVACLWKEALQPYDAFGTLMWVLRRRLVGASGGGGGGLHEQPWVTPAASCVAALERGGHAAGARARAIAGGGERSADTSVASFE